MVQKYRVTTSEDKIINRKRKDYEMASYFLGIDIRIKMASRESNGNKKAIHFGIPRSMILLETRKRFLEVKNKARVIMDIAKSLFHVDFLLQIRMKEGRFDIHPMDLPFM